MNAHYCPTPSYGGKIYPGTKFTLEFLLGPKFTLEYTLGQKCYPGIYPGTKMLPWNYSGIKFTLECDPLTYGLLGLSPWICALGSFLAYDFDI
jgi:hypothetical protein